MKLLFVYPNIIESPKDISTGISTIAAICKNEGHKVDLIDTTFGMSDSEILKKAKSFNPDVIAITIATNDFKYATHISKLLKRELGKLIIAGGFHPTIAPEEVIAEKCFDIVCVGEGEEAIIEILNKLNKKQSINNIKNLWIKEKNGNVIQNPIRNLLQDLDKIPFPDREIFNYKKYLDWNHGTATFISTRGCPFQCSYCINHFLIKKYKNKGNYIRFRSVDNLFKEIKQVLDKYGDYVKNIEFYDDTFTLNERRIEEFCKRYPKEIGLPFNINARVNSVNPKQFKMLKEAGCIRVSIGLESGDENIRNNILKRNMTDKQIIETFREAKKAGLKVYSFNMVGIPYETKESIKNTIRLNQKCQPDFVGVSIFNAFRGTEIYDLCEKQGLLKKGYSTSYFRDSNINHPNFTSKQLRRIRNNFGFKVFLGYRMLRGIVDIMDRNLSQINIYFSLRSKLIYKLKLLRK